MMTATGTTTFFLPLRILSAFFLSTFLLSPAGAAQTQRTKVSACAWRAATMAILRRSVMCADRG